MKITHLGLKELWTFLADSTEPMSTGVVILVSLAIIILLVCLICLIRRPIVERKVKARTRWINETAANYKKIHEAEEIFYKEKKVRMFDNGKRHISPGYAYDMVFDFDRNLVKKGMRLKEWDFYQIQSGRYVVQVTIGHISFAQNVQLTLLDLEEGKFHTTGIVKLFKGKKSMDMPPDPSVDNEIHYVDIKKNVDLHYVTKGKERHLYGSIISKDKVKFELDVILTRQEKHDAMVINTPFNDSFYHFYLNYKISNLIPKGTFKMGDFELKFNPKKDFGLLDWGRGVWPFKEIWYWGQVNDYLSDGRMISLNLGYGFGNLSAASENMLFLNGKAHKLGRLYIENDVTKDYMADWVIKSPDNKINLVMKTIYDRYSNTDFKLIYMKCHQVFGRYYGKVELEDGTIIELTGQLGFFERSNNQW